MDRIKKIEEILHRVTSLAQEDEEITALLIYGTRADDSHDLLSDLDLMVVTKNREHLVRHLEDHNDYSIEYEDRIVLFYILDNFTLKVDVTIAEDITKLQTLRGGGSFRFLVNKTNLTIPETEVSIEERIKYHINRTVESFYSMTIANQSSDKYRFMFYQFLVLQHLYTIEYHLAGYEEFSYLPKQLLRKIPKDLQRKYKKDFDPNSDLVNGVLRREQLLSWILDTLQRVREKYPDFENGASSFISKFHTQNLVWNFRDISTINPSTIKSGLIYRSSTPGTNLHPLASKAFSHIQTVIDLRYKEESEEFPYTLSNVTYHNVPVGEKHVRPHGMVYTEIGVDPFFYEYFPRHYGDEISEVMRLIICEEKPVMIHCHAGKDRTGMVVAMLQKLVGITDEDIVRDYVSSRFDTDERKIRITLEVIEEAGGIWQFLRYKGLSSEEISALQSLLSLE